MSRDPVYVRMVEQNAADEQARQKRNAEAQRQRKDQENKEAEAHADEQQAAADALPEQKARFEAAEKERAAKCVQSYSSRLAQAKVDAATALKSIAETKARCAVVVTKCAIAGSVSVCRGVTAAEKRFFDDVCRYWPDEGTQQERDYFGLLFDDSNGCADVVPLSGWLGSKPDELKAIMSAR